MTTRDPRQRAFYLFIACLLGVASFYGGTQLIIRQSTPPVHPATGRQIAGISTDRSWLDRPARQQEEAPDQALAVVGIRSAPTHRMSMADAQAKWRPRDSSSIALFPSYLVNTS